MKWKEWPNMKIRCPDLGRICWTNFHDYSVSEVFSQYSTQRLRFQTSGEKTLIMSRISHRERSGAFETFWGWQFDKVMRAACVYMYMLIQYTYVMFSVHYGQFNISNFFVIITQTLPSNRSGFHIHINSLSSWFRIRILLIHPGGQQKQCRHLTRVVQRFHSTMSSFAPGCPWVVERWGWGEVCSRFRSKKCCDMLVVVSLAKKPGEVWTYFEVTLSETNSLHLKMDAWKTILSFWEGLFSEAMLVVG